MLLQKCVRVNSTSRICGCLHDSRQCLQCQPHLLNVWISRSNPAPITKWASGLCQDMLGKFEPFLMTGLLILRCAGKLKSCHPVQRRENRLLAIFLRLAPQNDAKGKFGYTVQSYGAWDVKSRCCLTFFAASNVRQALLFFGGFVEELLAYSEIGIADFHGKVGCQVVHQPVTKLRVGFA